MVLTSFVFYVRNLTPLNRLLVDSWNSAKFIIGNMAETGFTSMHLYSLFSLRVNSLLRTWFYPDLDDVFVHMNSICSVSRKAVRISVKRYFVVRGFNLQTSSCGIISPASPCDPSTLSISVAPPVRAQLLHPTSHLWVIVFR